MQYTATASVVWAHRYPPMAALARRFGLTCSPLYPCESGTVPNQLHEGDEWALRPVAIGAWDAQGGRGGCSTPLDMDTGHMASADSTLHTQLPNAGWLQLRCVPPADMLLSVVFSFPLLLIARYGQVHGTTPHQYPASRFTRLLRARDDTWTSHLPCISAQDVQRCLVCFAAAVRHVCEVDSSLLPEVCARPVLAALLCWGWNARGRRSLVLRRASMRA